VTAPTRKRSAPFDGVTIDHLRVLVAVADAGSFSAGARVLGRVQSAVSQSMAAFESFVGIKVWDRSERSVQLTDRGRVLVGAARRVLAETERLREVAKALEGGAEGRVSICVDSLFPARALVSLAIDMQKAFPALELRIETDTLASVAGRVARRECDVGIAGPLAQSEALERVAVGSVLLVPVAARGHRLATIEGAIPSSSARDETQIVLSESDRAASPDQGVLARRTWRVVDLATKRELILGGLGWGNLPEPLVRDDLRRGDLLRLDIEAWTAEEHRLPLALVFPPGMRRRPFIRWLIANVPPLCNSWGVGLSSGTPAPGSSGTPAPGSR
jgi:DNA-binding transcriptional LysR family regulator